MAESLITSLFPKTKNGHVQTTTNTISKKESSIFYENHAKKITNQCCNQVCQLEKNRLQTIISETKVKIGKIESSLAACLEVCEKKDQKIFEMRRCTKESGNKNQLKSTLPFNEFSEDISLDQLAHLRSIGPTPAEDSNFVLNCVRSLYSGHLHVLNQRTLTGRNAKGKQKKQMTPRKRKVIEDMYNQRLDMVCDDGIKRGERLKKINSHIKNAILKAAQKEDEIILDQQSLQCP